MVLVKVALHICRKGVDYLKSAGRSCDLVLDDLSEVATSIVVSLLICKLSL